MMLLALALLSTSPQDLLRKAVEEVKILDVRPEKKRVRPAEPFKVAFDLEIPEGWHLYPTTPTSTGTVTKAVVEGFDVLGPYEEPAPKTKPKSEFLEAYDYHEGKITITVRLRAKPGVAAGPQDVKGRFEYQLCKTICRDGKAAFAFPLDIRPRPTAEVRIVSATPDKAELKVGETLKLALVVEVPKDWHIYPTVPTTTGTPTEVVFEAAERAGPIVEPAPKTHPAEGDQPAYTYHEGTITLTQPFFLKPGPQPGPFELRGVLDYQICKPGICIPVKTDFAVALKVVDGQAVPPPPLPPAKGGASGAAARDLASKGLLVSLGVAALGGLISLLMPCVYPLIPMTLTYFVKQGAGSRAQSMAMSTAYAAGIITVFTGIGFLLSLALGPAGARIFAANPWVNLAVGALFLWFTFSLFGLYEINLPGWLVGSLTGQRRSGVAGAFILGSLFSVVTFTCTIPIAGGVLALAAGSGAEVKFIALLAMLVYSTTMALPFFFLGLFPGLIKEIPKSGGWLHTVKVTAGFAEFALAFYYFSKADVVWELGILNQDVVIGIWIAALLFMALYLLKLIRIKGDDEEASPVGVFRLIAAFVFVLAALQFGTLYAGRKPGLLAFVLPPADVVEAAAGGATEAVAAGHGSLAPALAEAKKTGKPVFLEFTGKTCSNCQVMKSSVIDHPQVQAVLKDFVFAELYTDATPWKAENAKLQDERFGTVALPLYVILSPDDKELARLALDTGLVGREDFIAFLRKGLAARP